MEFFPFRLLNVRRYPEEEEDEEEEYDSGDDNYDDDMMRVVQRRNLSIHAMLHTVSQSKQTSINIDVFTKPNEMYCVN